MSRVQGKYVWQDREIRFDLPNHALELRPGEILLDTLPNVEDSKGNSGESGSLLITNLRMIWICTKFSRTNLTIGYACIVGVNIRTTTTRLRGTNQALFVLTKFNNTRFEFIFTNLVPNNPRLFNTIQTVHKEYERTRLYRDLKLRGAIVKDKQLLLLPEENIYHKVSGVWNLSSDQGNLGTFFITNVRVVWYADLAENFNVSVPFLQMKSVRVRDSKFGLALVIETMPQSGGYVLGFRIDPQEKLNEVAKEIQHVQAISVKSPMFGISISPNEKILPASQLKSPDDVEILEVQENTDAFAVYFSATNRETDRPPIYNPEIGLAVEKLGDGMSIQSLWNVTV